MFFDQFSAAKRVKIDHWNIIYYLLINTSIEVPWVDSRTTTYKRTVIILWIEHVRGSIRPNLANVLHIVESSKVTVIPNGVYCNIEEIWKSRVFCKPFLDPDADYLSAALWFDIPSSAVRSVRGVNMDSPSLDRLNGPGASYLDCLKSVHIIPI